MIAAESAITPLLVAILLIGAMVLVGLSELVGWLMARSAERALERHDDEVDRRTRT